VAERPIETRISGSTRKGVFMQLSGSRTNSSITLPVRIFFSGHEQTAPSHACGPGVWPHYLLHYVLAGHGTFTSGGNTFRLNAGDGFLIIPGVISSYKASEESPWEYCWIGFDGRDAGNTLNSCGINAENPVFHAPSFEKGKGGLHIGTEPEQEYMTIGDVLLSINNVLRQEPENVYLHLSLLYRFFALLQPGSAPGHRDSTGYLQKAVDYIQNNYAYDIKIRDVARYVGIDRTYLYKLFCQELGMSPQQYLIGYRLSVAKQMLTSTGLRVSEIANSCGFVDSTSFCHQFRGQFLMTPSQFRKAPGGSPV